jgi:hypothetical protein
VPRRLSRKAALPPLHAEGDLAAIHRGVPRILALPIPRAFGRTCHVPVFRRSRLVPSFGAHHRCRHEEVLRFVGVQTGSPLLSGPRGRRFESCQPDLFRTP